MFDKILVPLDGSELAEKALAYARELAAKFDAELILMQVLHPAAIRADFGETRCFTPELFYEMKAKITTYLSLHQEQLQQRRIRTRIEVLSGNPVAEMIIEMARDENIDLIVMSTHGYSGSDHWLYGSVASKILEKAPCPVFLVRVK